jgi:hypothetical protein
MWNVVADVFEAGKGGVVEADMLSIPRLLLFSYESAVEDVFERTKYTPSIA